MEKEKRVYARDQNWRIRLTLGLGAAGLAGLSSRADSAARAMTGGGIRCATSAGCGNGF